MVRFPSLEPLVLQPYRPLIYSNPGRPDDRLVAVSGLAEVIGNTIRCEEYFVGLWKLDMIRGLMWYTEGAPLIPRKPLTNDGFPTWSWASAEFALVKIDHGDEKTSLSRVENVQVDLVDKR